MPNHAHHSIFANLASCQNWHHAKSCTLRHVCKSGIMPNLASCQIMHTMTCLLGFMPNLASCKIMHTTTCLQIWYHAKLGFMQNHAHHEMFAWLHAKSCTPRHVCKFGIMPNLASCKIMHTTKCLLGFMQNHAHHDMFASLASHPRPTKLDSTIT